VPHVLEVRRVGGSISQTSSNSVSGISPPPTPRGNGGVLKKESAWRGFPPRGTDPDTGGLRRTAKPKASRKPSLGQASSAHPAGGQRLLREPRLTREATGGLSGGGSDTINGHLCEKWRRAFGGAAGTREAPGNDDIEALPVGSYDDLFRTA